MNYSLSSKIYEELISKYLRTNRIEPNEIVCIKNGAIAHFKQLEMKRACELFQLVEDYKQLTEKDWEMYLLALRNCGEYKRSFELSQYCHQLYPNNSFFIRFCDCTDRPEDTFLSIGQYNVQPFTFNSNYGEFAPSYSKDYLYFSSKKVRKSSLHPFYGWDGDFFISLQKVKREGDSLIGMTELALFEGNNNNGHDGPISFNKTEDILVLTRSTPNSGHVSLFYAEKTRDQWSELKPFPYNNEHFDVGHGSFSKEENQLYFSSDSPGGFGGADLYVSHFIEGNWTEPLNLGKYINTEQNEFFPFVMDSLLYFSSNGHCGLGGLDLFKTQLSSKQLPENLGKQINTMEDDFSLVFSEDKHVGFFASNRGDNIDRIYHFTHSVPLIKLRGLVTIQTHHKKPICNQVVELIDKDTKETFSITSDSLGRFDAPLKHNTNYQIIAKNDAGLEIKHALKTNLPLHDTIFTCELQFFSNEVLVELSLLDKSTLLPLPFGTLTMIDPSTNRDTTLLSDRNGKIKFSCEPNKIVETIASKKGYIDEQMTFTTPDDRDTLHLAVSLGRIEQGKIFTVENIYYDLDKSSLREESKYSLNRLAAFVLENNIRIELSSHTDSRGSITYNNRLSQERAESCVKYLIANGIVDKNIIAKGYGETQLVNNCSDGYECSEEQHQQNRRTEVKILDVNQ